MTAVYLLIMIVAIYFFYTKKYTAFLLSYYAIISGLFMLDRVTSEARCGDYCIILTLALVFILPRLYKAGKDGATDETLNYRFLGPGCPITTALWVFLLFGLAELVITFVSGAESLSFALKVWRINLLFLSYFVFSAVPAGAFRKFFRIGLYITLFQTFLYYLQLLDIHLLSGYNPDASDELGYMVMLNLPMLSVFYIFYCLADKEMGWEKYLFSTLFMSSILLSSARTWLIAVCAGIIVYLILAKNRKQFIAACLIAVLLTPLAMLMLSRKNSHSDKSTHDDLMNLTSNLDALDMMNSKSGTMTFRIAMLYERYMYLRDNPKYLLFGVGDIHEDSPKCTDRFDFVLGTANREKTYGKCLIESGDITWVPVLLRYGVVGTLVCLYLLITILIVALKRKDALYMIAPTVLFYLIASISGPLFESSSRIYLLVLLSAWIYRTDLEKKLVNGNSPVI